MQTFLPYPSFYQSAHALDLSRLGKQVIEAGQITRALFDPDYGWQHHPAVLMWRGSEPRLLAYARACGREWQDRRGQMHGAWPNLLDWLTERGIGGLTYDHPPFWLGDERLHASHRSNLLRKDPEHYGSFDWTEPDDLPYWWPVTAAMSAPRT